jgi:hypothetical protein
MKTVILLIIVSFVSSCANPNVYESTQPKADFLSMEDRKFTSPIAPDPRHTPEEATKYVHWWVENVRPSKRDVFEAALQGNHDALRDILTDTNNSYGPPDQNGYDASTLTGAYMLALGDEEFARFISAQPLTTQGNVFSNFLTGPWSFTESEFSRLFPRTAELRKKFYASQRALTN